MEKKDKSLFKLYTELIERTKDKQVLILFNGANLHPSLLDVLKTFNVYMWFDDPESSDDLSKPVAKYFNACFVGNIASLNQYMSWGCKNIFYKPLGYFNSHIHSHILEIGQIDLDNRDIDVCLFVKEKVNTEKVD